MFYFSHMCEPSVNVTKGRHYSEPPPSNEDIAFLEPLVDCKRRITNCYNIKLSDFLLTVDQVYQWRSHDHHEIEGIFLRGCYFAVPAVMLAFGHPRPVCKAVHVVSQSEILVFSPVTAYSVKRHKLMSINGSFHSEARLCSRTRTKMRSSYSLLTF